MVIFLKGTLGYYVSQKCYFKGGRGGGSLRKLYGIKKELKKILEPPLVLLNILTLPKFINAKIQMFIEHDKKISINTKKKYILKIHLA